MDAKKFIIDHIVLLVNKFPQLKIRYEIDNATNFHYIEVLPVSEFTLNEKYAEFEIHLSVRFYKKFPKSSIGFIKDGDIFNITNPVYEEEGYLYDIY